MQVNICVDLDGTIAEYIKWEGVENIGKPLMGAKEFLNLLRKIGPVIIFTNRCTASIQGKSPEELQQIVIDYLEKYELEYDDVWIGQGKPFGIIVDDNAVQCRPQEHGSEIYDEVLKEVTRIIGGYMGTE